MRPLIALTGQPTDPLNASIAASGGEPKALPGLDVALLSALARTDGLLLSGADDALDFAALAAARELRLPVLAVGRGTQVLNVAFGGTLRPHPRAADPVRPVEVLPGSRLHAATGRERLDVAGCRDHSLARLGAGLMVSAIAAGGGVEAVETSDIIAVQWQPGAGAGDAALFADLVERSASRVAA